MPRERARLLGHIHGRRQPRSRARFRVRIRASVPARWSRHLGASPPSFVLSRVAPSRHDQPLPVRKRPFVQLLPQGVAGKVRPAARRCRSSVCIRLFLDPSLRGRSSSHLGATETVRTTPSGLSTELSLSIYYLDCRRKVETVFAEVRANCSNCCTGSSSISGRDCP